MQFQVLHFLINEDIISRGEKKERNLCVSWVFLNWPLCKERLLVPGLWGAPKDSLDQEEGFEGPARLEEEFQGHLP